MDMEALFAGLLNGDMSFEREPVQIDPGLEKWFPAYFEERDQDRVVDPTGGGNAFLGGLAVALARGVVLEEAACWGSVSAGFCIEQVGVPVLGTDEDRKETWNGERVEDRLQKFMKRVGVKTER
jgi:bifunctional ADP-heptose synthase (sugar kinase/adenylyltransferase)